jgi:hypothetical protein
MARWLTARSEALQISRSELGRQIFKEIMQYEHLANRIFSKIEREREKAAKRSSST